MKVGYLKGEPSVEWALPGSTQERRGIRLFPEEGLEQRGNASQQRGSRPGGPRVGARGEIQKKHRAEGSLACRAMHSK